MSVISVVQEHQGLLIVSVLVAAFVLYRLFTRKSAEMEELEREYQEIVQMGKQTPRRSFAADVDE